MSTEYFESSRTRSFCPWKGLASYCSLVVDGLVNQDAAWYYPRPTCLARKVKGGVAFWNGVCIEPVAPTAETPSGPDVGTVR